MHRRIALVLLFVFFASLLVHPIYSINQDIGRHLKSGEIIWQTKSVYKTNLFSFTEPDQPFINHHWFSEVVFYGLSSFIGLKGLILFKASILLLALFFIYLAVKRLPSWTFILSALIGIFVLTERTDVRPEIFSYLFMSFFLFAILRAKDGQVKWLYALPILQLFWTNMHIYFVLGPILMLFFLIDRHSTDRANFKRYAILFLAVSVSTFFNPNFIHGALYPLQILNNYGYSIAENQNIFFLRDYGISVGKIQFFQLSVVLLLVSFILSRKNKKLGLFEILASGFFTIMGFLMLRNFAIYALLFIPVMAINLSSLNLRKPASILYFGISVLLALLAWNNVRADKFSFAVPTGGEKGIEFLRENKISGPVFNNFDVGSFLIWKMYPEQKVFVDGRPEAYSKDFFDKIYKPMQEDQAMWEKYSKEYGINYIFFDHHDMTPWARTFLNRISKDERWPMVYSDEYVVIFLKR